MCVWRALVKHRNATLVMAHVVVKWCGPPANARTVVYNDNFRTATYKMQTFSAIAGASRVKIKRFRVDVRCALMRLALLCFYEHLRFCYKLPRLY